MLTWKQFNEIPNGTRVINHGWDQCVALANLYHESVIGGSFVGVPSAYMWWTQFGSWKTLTDNYRTSQTPVPGAIFVSRYGLYDAPNGHIGVVTSVNGNGTFNTMEQNAGTWRYVGRYTRDMRNILGFLVPRDNPATPKHDQAEKPTTSTQKIRKRNKETEDMVYIYRKISGGAQYALFRLGQKGSWMEFTGQASANQLADQHGKAMAVSDNFWNDLKKRHN